MRLDAALHAGAVVEVWRATMPSGEHAAIKLLKRRWLGHPGAVELMRREHRAISTMHHLHIVRLVDFLEHDGGCALATEYLGGGDLVSLTGMAPTHWIDTALALVSALEHVHARGYVHADVKARNVLFAAGNRAKLVDFGTAVPIGTRLPRGGRTREHEPQGCGFAREYAEEGARAMPATDVYALAVLLYELLTGRLPFGGCDAGTVAAVLAGAAATSRGEASVAVDEIDSPSKCVDSESRPVIALADSIVATLRAEDSNEVGTLMQFANVLESVRSADIARQRNE